MGRRRQVTSGLISVVLTAIMWEVTDWIPRLTFPAKLLFCGAIFFVSFVVGSILTGGR